MTIIYFTPDCEYSMDELNSMTDEELTRIANDCNDAKIYTPREFELAFNVWEDISDLGVIKIIE